MELEQFHRFWARVLVHPDERGGNAFAPDPVASPFQSPFDRGGQGSKQGLYATPPKVLLRICSLAVFQPSIKCLMRVPELDLTGGVLGPHFGLHHHQVYRVIVVPEIMYHGGRMGTVLFAEYRYCHGLFPLGRPARDSNSRAFSPKMRRLAWSGSPNPSSNVWSPRSQLSVPYSTLCWCSDKKRSANR